LHVWNGFGEEMQMKSVKLDLNIDKLEEEGIVNLYGQVDVNTEALLNDKTKFEIKYITGGKASLIEKKTQVVLHGIIKYNYCYDF
jgi:hypothetical protein